MESVALLPWNQHVRNSGFGRMETTSKAPPEGGLWFLESLYHPNVPSALPDGQNVNFVLKPIRSSINFVMPDDLGDATVCLYPGNPLGRIAEVWVRDPEDASGTGYGPCQVHNSAQPLPPDYDYARFVKSFTLIESASLPAGSYVLNGRAVAVQFPYPAGEKPSIDGTTSAASKYSYEALVGTQSDPQSIVAGVKMDDAICVLSVGGTNEKPVRLGDSVVTSGSYTKVQANDARQALTYTVNSDPAVDQTVAISQTKIYWRTGKMLCSAVGGVLGNLSYKGSFVPGDPGPIPLKVGLFLESYDLMGRAIDTQEVVITVLWNGASMTEVDYSRSESFSLPKVGELLNKPVIHQLQAGIWIQTVEDIALGIDHLDINISGDVEAITGDAHWVARPSLLWAVAGAKAQQFNVEMTQWFEATPNSNLLQTTTTIAVPFGSVKDLQDFWTGLRSLMDSGDFSYVWKYSEWKRLGQSFHPAQMMQWQAIAPMVIEDFCYSDEDGDMSSAKKFFEKVGHELKRGGKKALKDVLKVGKAVSRELAPEVLDLAINKLGGVAGLTDQQKAAAMHILKPQVQKALMAGGSLAGGSLATRKRRPQMRLVGNCATKGLVPAIAPLPDIEDIVPWDSGFRRGNARSSYVLDQVERRKLTENQVVQFTKDPANLIGGCCSGKLVAKAQPKNRPTVEKVEHELKWSSTRGTFVPALFFHQLPNHDAILSSSGLYYLWRDPQLHQSLASTQSWSRDSKGTLLVGHDDPHVPIEILLPKDCVLIGVNSAEYKDGDIFIKGDLSRPATGRSVEAACLATKFLLERNTGFKSPMAITGDMKAPSDGLGWRLAEMPVEFGYFKKRAAKSLVKGFALPIIGNWKGADIPVQTVAELKKAIQLTTQHRGGMCATSLDLGPIDLWKRGLNEQFALEFWMAESLLMATEPGYNVKIGGVWYWSQEELLANLQDKPMSYGVCATKVTVIPTAKAKAKAAPKASPKAVNANVNKAQQQKTDEVLKLLKEIKTQNDLIIQEIRVLKKGKPDAKTKFLSLANKLSIEEQDPKRKKIFERIAAFGDAINFPPAKVGKLMTALRNLEVPDNVGKLEKVTFAIQKKDGSDEEFELDLTKPTKQELLPPDSKVLKIRKQKLKEQ